MKIVALGLVGALAGALALAALLDARNLRLVARYLPDPAMTANVFRLFAAEVDARECISLAGVAAEQEDVRVHVLSRNEFLSLLDKHLLQDAATLIAAQWLRAQG